MGRGGTERTCLFARLDSVCASSSPISRISSYHAHTHRDQRMLRPLLLFFISFFRVERLRMLRREAFNMRHVACIVHHASCIMPHALLPFLAPQRRQASAAAKKGRGREACNMRHVACVVHHASCSMPHALLPFLAPQRLATCSTKMQHATCNMQRASFDVVAEDELAVRREHRGRGLSRASPRGRPARRRLHVACCMLPVAEAAKHATCDM